MEQSARYPLCLEVSIRFNEVNDVFCGIDITGNFPAGLSEAELYDFLAGIEQNIIKKYQFMTKK